MKKIIKVLIVLVSISLTGCLGNKAQYGAAGGAAGGALIGQSIGHDTEATLIGAAVGTMLGYMGGNEMDKFDRNYRVVPRQQPVHDTRGYYQQAPSQQYRRAPQQQNWQEGW